MSIPVGFPMVNLGNLYIDGLAISPGATNILVDLGAGAARDSTNQDDIVLLAPVVINSAFVGPNGIDTGVLAVTTTYYVYVIGSSLSANPEIDIETQVSTMAAGSNILNGIVISEGIVAQPPSTVNNNPQPAGLLSLSPTLPNLPEGYDMFRLLGSVSTDGAAHIIPFNQIGGNGNNALFMYATPVNVLTAGVSAVFAPIVLTAAVPASAGGTSGFVQVYLDVLLTPTAAGNSVSFRPTGSASVNGQVTVSGDVAGVVAERQVVATASVIAGVVSIDYKVTGSVTVNVVGYVNQA